MKCQRLACVCVVVAAGILVAGCAGEGEGEGEGEGDVACEGNAHLVVDEAGGCDLGVVKVGDTATCTITVRNDGACPADVASAAADFGDVVDFVRSEVVPGEIDTLPVTVRDTPSAAGPHEGQVVLTTASGALFSFPLVEDARNGPSCVASASATSGFVDDAIALDSSATAVGDDGAVILSRTWSVTGSGSLSSSTDVTTTLTATGLGTAHVSLLAFDDAGLSCTSGVDVTFAPRLVVSLDPPTFLAGYVAHVFPASDAAACGALDCFDVDTCSVVAGTAPDWDGDGSFSDGDPRFDPATGVQVALPPAGDYVVAVEATAAADTTVNAGIFISVDGGDPQAFANASLAPGDLWTVANIAFDDVSAAVTSVDTIGASPCP